MYNFYRYNGKATSRTHLSKSLTVYFSEAYPHFGVITRNSITTKSLGKKGVVYTHIYFALLSFCTAAD